MEAKQEAKTPRTVIGPAAAGPLMCFRCVTGVCAHQNRLGDPHGGGLVPAITIKDGTALCLDCAMFR